MNTRQYMQDNGFGWQVEKFDAYAKVNGKMVRVPNRQFTGRNDGEPVIFESVSPSYKIIQHTEGFDFLNDLVDSDGLVVDNIMEKGNGKVVIINTYMPEHVTIAGSEIQRYLGFVAKHDKSGSAFALAHNMQLSCTNQLNALGMGKFKYAIRHSRSAKIKLHDARRALEMGFKFTDNLKVIGEKMATEKINKDYYNRFLRQVTGLDKLDKDKNPRAHRNAQGLRYNIHNIMRNADYIDNYRNTKWGLYQAVTDVSSNVKTYRDEGTKFMQTASGHPLANRAFELLTA